MEMDTERIGKRIKTLREEKGWSLRDLERETGVSRSMLSMYERGRTKKISMEALQGIARALGVPVEDLVEESVEDETLKALGQSFRVVLLKKASELSPRGRKNLLQYLEFILEEERRKKTP